MYEENCMRNNFQGTRPVLYRNRLEKINVLDPLGLESCEGGV